jgi:opacity protein-like surface antigen
MKRNLLTVCICALLATISGNSFAQKLSVGEFTGFNFSNLHGNLTSNKWEAKPGPSAGIFFEYNLTRSFSLQTEIGFLSHYYEMKTYQYLRPEVYYLDSYYTSGLSSSAITSPVSVNYNWDFSFLRFPLMIKYNTPTRLQLGIGGGVYYSLLMNDDLTKEERNATQNDSHTPYPPTHDWGYLFSADLSYPVTNQLRLFISGRLSTGKKVFIEEYRGKNGSNELLFGFKFAPNLSKNLKIKDNSRTDADSSFSRLYIKPGVGATMSWNSAAEQFGNYSANLSTKTGIIIGCHLDKTVSLQSGVQFERKGYSMSDSSIYYHRYASNVNYHGDKVDSKVSLDYLTVPVNFKLSFGDPFTFYVDFGAYAGFLVNANLSGTIIRKYSGSSYYRLDKINLNDAVEGYYKSTDFGYLAGLGFQFPFMKNMKFDIGIHYAKGFKNVLKAPEENENNGSKRDLSFQNSSLSLQFGLQIPIPN